MNFQNCTGENGFSNEECLSLIFFGFLTEAFSNTIFIFRTIYGNVKIICPNIIRGIPGLTPKIPQKRSTENPKALVGIAIGKSTKASRIFFPLKLYLVKIIETGKAMIISKITATVAIVNDTPNDFKILIHCRSPMSSSAKTVE